jgi:signal transduction histidine kinase
MKINVQDRQDIYFIAKELINNILKHSGANKVFISIQSKGTSFLILVQDNGVGLSNTPGKNGQGLHNIHMRAQRLNALFSVQQDGPGCIARLEIPKFF